MKNENSPWNDGRRWQVSNKRRSRKNSWPSDVQHFDWKKFWLKREGFIQLFNADSNSFYEMAVVF